MKIDRSKLKKSSSEVPADCKNLIDKLKVRSRAQVSLFVLKRSIIIIFLRAVVRISFCRS